MARKTLKNDWAQFEKGKFHLENNVWNKGNLVNGDDYTQTIAFNPKDLTRDVVMNWDWPDAEGIVAYPEIIAGYKPWSGNGSGAMTERLSAIKSFNLSLDYEISGDTDRFNVAVDMWFTRKPWAGGNSIQTEVKILTHQGEVANPAGSKVGEYSHGALTADIWIDEDYSNPGNTKSWRYVTVVAQEDVLDAKLDMDHLLDTLVQMGHLNKKLYFNGYEFGAEHAGGSGQLDIDHIGHRILAQERFSYEAAATSDILL